MSKRTTTKSSTPSSSKPSTCSMTREGDRSPQPPLDLRAIAIYLLLAIVLARLSFTSYASATLFGPLALHIAFIAVYYFCFYRSSSEGSRRDRAKPAEQPPLPSLWLLPGLLVNLGALFWWVGSSGYKTPIPMNIEVIATITLVPIVEEIFFRAGVSELWRRAAGPWLGSIASAVYFAVLHGDGDIFAANVLTWLPLGPFLLALCCELLYRQTKRIRVACYFHLSCNLSAVLFYSGMPSDWLRYLYT